MDKTKILEILERHQNDNLYSECAREKIAEEILSSESEPEQKAKFVSLLELLKLSKC